MSHPADMAWNAYLTKGEYEHFLDSCHNFLDKRSSDMSWEELQKKIDSQARFEEEHVILAYTRIPFPEPEYWTLIGEVADKELCEGRRSLEEFKAIHLRRWAAYGKEMENKEEITIFECAFLQNHIFELIGTYEKTDEEITNYLLELLDTVRPLNPAMVYIKPTDVKSIIENAAAERKAQNPSQKDWIDEMANWVKNTKYGINHKLSGREGVVSFCKERLRIDELVLPKLCIPITWIHRK
jgi:hypothetical protein